jgi:hypothetical protein
VIRLAGETVNVPFSRSNRASSIIVIRAICGFLFEATTNFKNRADVLGDYLLGVALVGKRRIGGC